jgi:ATP-binding cassette subfamily B protein
MLAGLYPADRIRISLDGAPTELADLAAFAVLVPQEPEIFDADVRANLTLSGGQRQRLALARGLLAASGSSLVFLDEPTSSIDPVTEARIYDGVLSSLGDACVVSSIHRLHLLPRFDTIVMLDAGRVVDTGTLDELLARQPMFREMWRGYTSSPDSNAGANAA